MKTQNKKESKNKKETKFFNLDRKEEKNIIKIPITKIQKLKNKHQKLLLIIAILLLIILIIFLIPKEKNKTDIEIKETTTKIEEQIEDLTVYDINSKTRPYAVMIPNDSSAKKRQYGIQNAYY